MQIDRALVDGGDVCPSLRVYEWTRPAITAGLFSEPELLLNLDQCRTLSLDIVKRPTGGGILFHHTDLVCSFFIPHAAALRETVDALNARLLAALTPFLPPPNTSSVTPSAGAVQFCMAQASPSDLLWNGRKIGGGAQRKSRAGLLHQVSLFLQKPDWESIAACVRRTEDAQTMQKASASLEELSLRPVDRRLVREAVAEQFHGEFL